MDALKLVIGSLILLHSCSAPRNSVPTAPIILTDARLNAPLTCLRNGDMVCFGEYVDKEPQFIYNHFEKYYSIKVFRDFVNSQLAMLIFREGAISQITGASHLPSFKTMALESNIIEGCAEDCIGMPFITMQNSTRRLQYHLRMQCGTAQCRIKYFIATDCLPPYCKKVKP